MGEIWVDYAWAARPDDLLQSLNECKPHIVHFSGHGSQAGAILLHSEDGHAKAVSAGAIKTLFSTLKNNIRVVILNACYSRSQAEALIEVIDCAIGMHEAIGDRAATIFAASFYRAVGFGCSVQEAYEQGKTALMLEGTSQEDIPDLLVRTNIDPSQIFLLEKDVQQEESIPNEEDVNGKLAPPSQRHSYVKRSCPRCFEQFYPGECPIVSEQSGRILKVAPTEWIAKQKARMFPERLDGKYVLEFARRHCPYCHYSLPYNIERVRNIHLAVVGDIYSGKSEYLAALIHELQQGRWLPQQQHFRFTCLTPFVEENMLHKDERTAGVFRAIQPTRPASPSERSEPLIYELHVSTLPNQPPKSINLMFYDTSGEDYTRERLPFQGRHVLNADAIIFLVDPEMMPDVVSRLPTYLAYLRPPHLQIGRGRRATPFFNDILDLFMNYHQLNARKTVPIPIAITLSKSDLFKFLRATSQSYLFMRHSAQSGLDLTEVDAIDREVRNVLVDFGDSTILQATNGLPKVKYFAVSATGYPTDQSGYYPSFDPCRCLDPFLWILHQLDIYHT